MTSSEGADEPAVNYSQAGVSPEQTAADRDHDRTPAKQSSGSTSGPLGPDERLAKAKKDTETEQAKVAAATQRVQELQAFIAELQAEIDEREQLVKGYTYDDHKMELGELTDAAEEKRRAADKVDAETRMGVDELEKKYQAELTTLKQEAAKDQDEATTRRNNHTLAVDELKKAQQKVDDVKGNVWDPLESTCRHASLSIL